MYLLEAFHRHNNRLREPIDFNHGEYFPVDPAIGSVDNSSQQYVFTVKFREDLTGLWYIDIGNSKLNPVIWHILWLFQKRDFRRFHN